MQKMMDAIVKSVAEYVYIPASNLVLIDEHLPEDVVVFF